MTLMKEDFVRFVLNTGRDKKNGIPDKRYVESHSEERKYEKFDYTVLVRTHTYLADRCRTINRRRRHKLTPSIHGM